MSAEDAHTQSNVPQNLQYLLHSDEPIAHISPTLAPVAAKASSSPYFSLNQSPPLSQPIPTSGSPIPDFRANSTYPPVIHMLSDVGKYHYYSIQGSGIREDPDSVDANFTLTKSSMSISSPICKNFSPRIATSASSQMHNPHDELDPEELDLATSILASLNGGFTQDPSSEYSWKGEIVHPFKIEKLCQCVQRLLYKERSLIDLSSGGTPICIFGDIHGEYRDLRRFTDLLRIEQATQTGMKFLFLGDYVDRGPHPVEVVAYLFALKVLHPNNIFMLSGNHEHSNYNSMRDSSGTYRLYKDTAKVYGKVKGKDVYSAMVAAFGVLPWAATIDGEIFCSHGGFPRYSSQEELVATLERMRTQSPLVDAYYDTLPMIPFHDVMYSDPILECDKDANNSSSEQKSGDGGSDTNDPTMPPSLASPIVKVQPALSSSSSQSSLSTQKETVKKAKKKDLASKKSESRGKSTKTKATVGLFPKGFCKNVHRKGRDDFPCSFTKEAFDGFCRVAKVNYLIRAHQHFDGYTGLRFEKRLFTIFTSTELFEVDSKKNGQAIIYYGGAFHVIILDSEQASVIV